MSHLVSLCTRENTCPVEITINPPAVSLPAFNWLTSSMVNVAIESPLIRNWSSRRYPAQVVQTSVPWSMSAYCGPLSSHSKQNLFASTFLTCFSAFSTSIEL